MHFKEQLAKLITGSAQLNFGPSHLKQIVFPLPSFLIQQRIISKLDKVDELLAERKQQLQKIDLIVKSRFPAESLNRLEVVA